MAASVLIPVRRPGSRDAALGRHIMTRGRLESRHTGTPVQPAGCQEWAAAEPGAARMLAGSPFGVQLDSGSPGARRALTLTIEAGLTTATPPGITFPARDAEAFVRDVKREVSAYFDQSGRSQKATPGMVVKTILLVGLTFGSYALLLLLDPSFWGALGLMVLTGIGFAGIGFAVTHDALHGAYSHRPAVNAAIGWLFDLLGANGYLWKITHNVIHHTYTNIDGIDEDLTVSPLLRLSPGAPLRPVHRFQHIYAFFAYGLSTLFWVFAKDFKYFFQRDLGPYRNKTHPPLEWMNLFLTKALYYGWAIVVPIVVLELPWWQYLICFVVMHLVAGAILGVVFQLAHVVEGTEYPVPDDGGRMEHQWLLHEMETTSNFARRNRLLTWYVGGLNYQVEHHLFPKICSAHYPAISPIVERVARRHGIPYHEQPTFFAAVRSHYRKLKVLGRDALQAAGQPSSLRASTQPS
jgi:linoleoyl-CoA desaturase